MKEKIFLYTGWGRVFRWHGVDAAGCIILTVTEEYALPKTTKVGRSPSRHGFGVSEMMPL